MNFLTAVIAILSLWASAALSFADAPTVTLKAADFGDGWPFKVPEIVLSCTLLDGRLHIVTFTAGGKTYALNGTARNLAKEKRWAEIDEIWRDDPAGHGIKVSVSPIIDKGLSLCDD